MRWRMKRGELSMEVIIIAAIALLVLVILSVLIIRAGGNVGQECRNIGGQCIEGDWTDIGVCGDGWQKSPNSCGSGKVCCVPVSDDSFI